MKNKQKKQAEKISKKESGHGRIAKTIENRKKIVEFIESEGNVKASDIAHHLGLSSARIRVIISELVEEGIVKVEGNGRSRRYLLTGKYK